MYTYITIFTIISMLIVAFYNTFVVKHNRKERQQTAEQPTHFDLLEDNGDQIPSSDDRSRASAPHPIHEPIVKRLRYFCINDKGYHVSVWPKDQGIQGLDYIEFSIAGITHGEHIDDHLGEFVATLKPDPANSYDAQAIKILARNGDRVGFVPKDMTREVRNFTNLPCECYCYIGKNNGVCYSCCYIPQN